MTTLSRQPRPEQHFAEPGPRFTKENRWSSILIQFLQGLFHRGLQTLQNLRVLTLVLKFLEDDLLKHTSISILASAMSCSLPLPLAIFWASESWLRTAWVCSVR